MTKSYAKESQPTHDDRHSQAAQWTSVRERPGCCSAVFRGHRRVVASSAWRCGITTEFLFPHRTRIHRAIMRCFASAGRWEPRAPSTLRRSTQGVPARRLRVCNPARHPRKNSPCTLAMDAMDRMLASMSPDDTAAALRLLSVLGECRQMSPTEAREWRRRITGWARFPEVGTAATWCLRRTSRGCWACALQPRDQPRIWIRNLHNMPPHTCPTGSQSRGGRGNAMTGGQGVVQNRADHVVEQPVAVQGHTR